MYGETDDKRQKNGFCFSVLFHVRVSAADGRLIFIELFRAEELQELAYEQQTRDRLITPKRGAILDRNRGKGLL